MGTTHAIMSCLTKTDWSGYWVMLKGENMATHYKGERINDLLARIEELTKVLDEHRTSDNILHITDERVARAYATLAWEKAKLTALRGEHGKD